MPEDLQTPEIVTKTIARSVGETVAKFVDILSTKNVKVSP